MDTHGIHYEGLKTALLEENKYDNPGIQPGYLLCPKIPSYRVHFQILLPRYTYVSEVFIHDDTYGHTDIYVCNGKFQS